MPRKAPDLATATHAAPQKKVVIEHGPLHEQQLFDAVGLLPAVAAFGGDDILQLVAEERYYLEIHEVAAQHELVSRAGAQR
eukprot:CAMPEP_0119285820 /NCGR_PEP_ID=MMETSP1329-20130426/32898_1 /TAXON_ID=114041 /ORGANISM="Genus nov. species nov., Strain RCC1024" /LENGTH=80 /DNA_ID=CAMNT_0007286541 /DNA_START=94 /DNA_END=333 /DNA_ORIENTATION=-